MKRRNVLIVDDEPDALVAVQAILESAGCDGIVTCGDTACMWGEMATGHVELVILDLIMPGTPGEETLARLREDYPDVPVIIATGVNELDTAIRCMRRGAHDYLLKPIESERLIVAVRHALELCDLQRTNAALRDSLFSVELQSPAAFSAIQSTDPNMIAIFKYLEAVSPSAHPILITGETGVGKELAARAIHSVSGRTGRFVAVNTAGLDDTMLADALFGHLKGAYTGADTARKGLVEQAAGGTLFLDEIGELSMASQVKLLRLLQEREFHPLGSDTARLSDARIVAATSRSEIDLQSSEHFRRDLYYRLKTHHIHLPPLRERKNDLRVLTDEFLRAAAAEYGKPVPTAPEELSALLDTWHFPGNVRELRAMVFDAVAAHTGKMLSLRTFKNAMGLTNGHGEAPASVTKPALTFHDRLPTFKESEALLLEEAMRRAKGNMTIAAGLLGVTRQAVSQRLKSRDEQ